ncbi:MerR family transcriptional regulator [Pontibaca salina]|uniref:MerR family transcriptional regulator n=1 Tax=Pontibaca salina TaxID=2795731 RepID=A0A934HS10_9RHOB|nr:MerR family transcriptional regulator [Pontibaca salina]MBI6629811.1 MerR family transcriptional regulator [Pontibaca salina]
MTKSPDAFRTISEVADWLGVQAHVLRFWESKFTQIKPVKRAGGRRYYRPADMQLLNGIKTLLHGQGMTIKGVQKLLREQGIAQVAALSQPLEDDGGIETIEYDSATVLPFAIGKTATTIKPGSATDSVVGLSGIGNLAETSPLPEQAAQTSIAEAPDAADPQTSARAETPVDSPSPDIDAVAPLVHAPLPYRPLQHLARLNRLSADQARDMAPLAQKLRAWVEQVSETPSG